MQRDEYIEANRRMWNQRAVIHSRRRGSEFLEQIASPDFTTFDQVEQRLFAGIGLAGKSVIQLACNNGRELISVKKAGAGRCLGVDLSDAFIEQARELARLAHSDVEFLRSSIYDVPHSLDESFDVVYITIGVLGWLRDLDRFFEIVRRLLRPSGQLFIYEMHPILDMFEPGSDLTMQSSYFRTEPFVTSGEQDYLDPSQTVEAVSYWFPHKLSDIIGGCLAYGLVLTHFAEYDHDLSMEYAALESLPNKPPLSYSLVARKPAP